MVQREKKRNWREKEKQAEIINGGISVGFGYTWGSVLGIFVFFPFLYSFTVLFFYVSFLFLSPCTDIWYLVLDWGGFISVCPVNLVFYEAGMRVFLVGIMMYHFPRDGRTRMHCATPGHG